MRILEEQRILLKANKGLHCHNPTQHQLNLIQVEVRHNYQSQCEADIRLSEELATEGYRQVQEDPLRSAWVRVYTNWSAVNLFDSVQFILKEL